jgi:hypothetical protein
MQHLFARTLILGAAVTVATTVVLAASAAVQGRSIAQPLNATAHWLYGPRSARIRYADLRHTFAAMVTHYGAAALWALVFELSKGHMPGRRSLAPAAWTSLLAAVVDYGVVPKRPTPGLELVLPKRPIVLVYGVMAVTLAVVDRLVQR